jgi:hypothetical protein
MFQPRSLAERLIVMASNSDASFLRTAESSLPMLFYSFFAKP